MLATTATANERVTGDVAEQLAARDVLVLRGSLDRESLHLAVVQLDRPEQRLAWLADHLGELRRLRHRLHPHRRRHPGGRRLPARARPRGGGVLRPDRDHRAATPSSRTCSPGASRRWSPPAPWGWGSTPRLGFVVNLGAPAVARSPTTSRSVAPAAAPTDADVVLLPACEDRDIWRYFASLAFPPEQHVRTALARARRGRPAGVHRHPRDLRRPRPQPARDDAQGARRRRRGPAACRAAGRRPGRTGSTTQERYDRVAAARRDEQAAMLGYIATDGCRMRFLREQSRRPGRRRLRPVRQLRRRRRVARRCRGPGGGRGRRAAAAARASPLDPRRCGRPRWPTSASTSRARSPTVAEEGRAVARLTDLGHGQALRALFGPDTPDGPVPPSLVEAVIEVMRDWAPAWPARPDGRRLRRVRTPPDADPRPRRRAGALHAAPGRRRAGRSRDLACRRGQGQSNSAQTGGGGTPPRPRSRSTSRATVDPVLLVDDLVATGWTMSIAGRPCAGPARRRCSRSGSAAGR